MTGAEAAEARRQAVAAWYAGEITETEATARIAEVNQLEDTDRQQQGKHPPVGNSDRQFFEAIKGLHAKTGPERRARPLRVPQRRRVRSVPVSRGVQDAIEQYLGGEVLPVADDRAFGPSGL